MFFDRELVPAGDAPQVVRVLRRSRRELDRVKCQPLRNQWAVLSNAESGPKH